MAISYSEVTELSSEENGLSQALEERIDTSLRDLKLSPSAAVIKVHVDARFANIPMRVFRDVESRYLMVGGWHAVTFIHHPEQLDTCGYFVFVPLDNQHACLASETFQTSRF